MKKFGFCAGFGVFLRTVHPLFSLFSHYDYKFSRINRFLLLLGQIGLITVLIWLAHSKLITDSIPLDEDYRSVYISAVLSVLTIPLPRCTFSFLQRDLYVFKTKETDAQEVMETEPVDTPIESEVKMKSK